MMELQKQNKVKLDEAAQKIELLEEYKEGVQNEELENVNSMLQVHQDLKTKEAENENLMQEL